MLNPRIVLLSLLASCGGTPETPDGGSDASHDAVTGGAWRAIQGCPGTQVTTDPSVMPTAAWTACPSGTPAGCAQLDNAWSSGVDVPHYFDVMMSRDGGFRMSIGHKVNNQNDSLQYTVLAMPSYTPVAAWRTSPSACHLEVVLGVEKVGLWEPHEMQLTTGKLADVTGGVSFTKLVPAPSGDVQAKSMSDTRFGFELSPPQQIAQVAIGAVNVTTTANLKTPRVSKDDVFVWQVDDGTGWSREQIARTTGVAETLIATANHHILDFATDGTAMYWLEAYGGAATTFDQPTVEVWRAPYTNTPIGLPSSKKLSETLTIGHLPLGYGGAHVAANLYGFLADDDVIVARWADGKTKRLTFTGDYKPLAISAMTTTDVFLIARDAKSGAEAVLRIPYGAF